MALQKIEYCADAYIRACVKLIPAQMLLDARNDVEGKVKSLVDSGAKIVDILEYIKKYPEKWKKKNKEQPESPDDTTPIDVYIDDYIKQMSSDFNEIINGVQLLLIKEELKTPIKEALTQHPLYTMQGDKEKLKLFFVGQEKSFRDSKSFDPFGKVIYQLLTGDYDENNDNNEPNLPPPLLFAEVECKKETDQIFWDWMNAVNSHLDLQKKAAEALKQWLGYASLDNKKVLIDALDALSNPQKSNLPPVPSNLKGKII